MYKQKIPLEEWIKVGRDTKHIRKLLMTKAEREPLRIAQNQLEKFRSHAEAVMYSNVENVNDQVLNDILYGDKDFEELHPEDKST